LLCILTLLCMDFVLADVKFVVLVRNSLGCKVGDSREVGVCAQGCFVLFHFRLRTHLPFRKREREYKNLPAEYVLCQHGKDICDWTLNIRTHIQAAAWQCRNEAYRKNFGTIDDVVFLYLSSKLFFIDPLRVLLCTETSSRVQNMPTLPLK
jgi:hypothetical protein